MAITKVTAAVADDTTDLKHIMQEGDRTNPYFHFKLKPGESAEYKIGYFARQDFIDNEQMMLSYGINKYASEIEVVK